MPAKDALPGTWLTYGLTQTEQRYSQLKQIDESNVGKLGLVWSAPLASAGGTEGTPLMWNNTVMFTQLFKNAILQQPFRNILKTPVTRQQAGGCEIAGGISQRSNDEITSTILKNVRRIACVCFDLGVTLPAGAQVEVPFAGIGWRIRRPIKLITPDEGPPRVRLSGRHDSEKHDRTEPLLFTRMLTNQARRRSLSPGCWHSMVRLMVIRELRLLTRNDAK